MHWIPASAPHLEHLSISGPFSLDELLSVVAAMPQLRIARLSGEIDRAAAASLVDPALRLEELYLHGCLINLVLELSSLQRLEISGESRIAGHLIVGSPCLHEMRCDGTVTGTVRLRKCEASLREFSGPECPFVTQQCTVLESAALLLQCDKPGRHAMDWDGPIPQKVREVRRPRGLFDGRLLSKIGTCQETSRFPLRTCFAAFAFDPAHGQLPLEPASAPATLSSHLVYRLSPGHTS